MNCVNISVDEETIANRSKVLLEVKSVPAAINRVDSGMSDPNAPHEPSTYEMTCLILRLSIPSVLANFVSFVPMNLGVFLAGRMDDPAKVAAFGLSYVVSSMMVVSFMYGLNSAQETLSSQAFGFENARLYGIYLNRGRLILTVFFIPFALAALVFGEKILLAAGQDSEVASLTQTLLLF